MSRKKKSQIEDLFQNKYEGFRVLVLGIGLFGSPSPVSMKQQKLKSVFWDRPNQTFVMKFDSGTETDYRVYTNVHRVMLFNWWDRGFKYNMLKVEG